MSQLAEFMSGRSLTGPARFAGPIFDAVGNGIATSSPATPVTLTINSATFQKMTPTASVNVILPSETISKGKPFRITNVSAGAFNLVLKDSTGVTTIATLNQNEATWVVCNGTSWDHAGIETIASS